MKPSRLLASAAVGLLVGIAVLAKESLNSGPQRYEFLELLGFATAYLLWGAKGNSVLWGIAIGFFITATVSGLMAYGVLNAFAPIKARR